MDLLSVEVIGTHSCSGCNGSLPEVVQRFCEDTGKHVNFKVYTVWDTDSTADIPEHIRTHISAMREGFKTSNGFFLNGQWLPLAHHDTEHVVSARKRLVEAAGMEPEDKYRALTGRDMNELYVSGSSMDKVQLDNSKVREWGSFSTHYDRIWFFEGSIKEIHIADCPVEKLTYSGYDILKLVEIAKQHPELFRSNADRIEPQLEKANIDDVSVRLLTLEDLSQGRHPCVIVNCKIDRDSKLHKEVASRFGGWGYEATYHSQVCGFVGIMPKDISYKDANYLPPGELPNESVLLLTCYAGGGVFGPQFHRIGIARKMIQQAIMDANSKGYLRMEAYAHPEVVPVLENCGFVRVEWRTDEDSPQAFYRIDLNNG